jgi:hypothetical protein
MQDSLTCFWVNEMRSKAVLTLDTRIWIKRACLGPHVANVNVEGSNPFARSISLNDLQLFPVRLCQICARPFLWL